MAYGETRDILVRLIASGETRVLKRPSEFSDQDKWWPAGWFPDGTRLLASSQSPRAGRIKTAIWSISVFTGNAIQLREGALGSAVSPDGSLVAALSGGNELNQEIWVMGPQGEEAHAIAVFPAKSESFYDSVQWLPTSRRLGYFKVQQNEGKYRVTLESTDLKGGSPTVLVSDASTWEDFSWLPDGRILYVAGEATPKGQNENFWEAVGGAGTVEGRERPAIALHHALG